MATIGKNVPKVFDGIEILCRIRRCKTGAGSNAYLEKRVEVASVAQLVQAARPLRLGNGLRLPTS